MKKEEILATCIDDIRSGKSTIEECVSRYPEMGKELISLLKIANGLKPEEATASAEFKQRAKRYLFEQMQNTSLKASRRPWFWPKQMPTRVLVSVLAGLVVLSAAGGGTVYAAQSSLPGDTLYTVKTGVENIQLAITTNPTAKANLHLELAQRRIDEAKQQVKQNRNVDTQALETVTQQYDSAIKELSNSNNTRKTNEILSRLSVETLNQQLELEQVMTHANQSSQTAVKQIIDATHRGNVIAQVAYSNHDYLKSQPSVADTNLDAGLFKIEGTLLSINSGNWNVDSTILKNVHYSGKIPDIGSRVKIQGMVKDGEFFISQIDISESYTEPTKVEGQYVGTYQNGTANIGGVPVKIAGDNNSQLKPGDNVRLEGQGNGQLNVTGKESPHQEPPNNTTLSGVLTAVDAANGTITVQMTGNQVIVNIKNARIESRNHNNRVINISDLENMISHDVKLDSLYKEGNLLFAQQMQIEAEK